METTSGKKGVSPEAQALTRKYRDRFVEFVKKEGLSEVSKRTGCNYQALRNSVVEGYNPSPDTVFQVKLGYGEEFDEVYVFTGKRLGVGEISSQLDSKKGYLNSPETVHDNDADQLRAKIYERERQISELKKDKRFLQNMIKSMQSTPISNSLERVLREFNDELITKLIYPYRPEKYDLKVTWRVIEDSISIIDDFRTKLRPLANQIEPDYYSQIMQLTDHDSALYELAAYDFDKDGFIKSKTSERNSADGGEGDPTKGSQQKAENVVEEAELNLLALYEIFDELI